MVRTAKAKTRATDLAPVVRPMMREWASLRTYCRTVTAEGTVERRVVGALERDIGAPAHCTGKRAGGLTA